MCPIDVVRDDVMDVNAEQQPPVDDMLKMMLEMLYNRFKQSTLNQWLAIWMN